jgi:hypothetical protein
LLGGKRERCLAAGNERGQEEEEEERREAKAERKKRWGGKSQVPTCAGCLLTRRIHTALHACLQSSLPELPEKKSIASSLK